VNEKDRRAFLAMVENIFCCFELMAPILDRFHSASLRPDASELRESFTTQRASTLLLRDSHKMSRDPVPPKPGDCNPPAFPRRTPYQRMPMLSPHTNRNHLYPMKPQRFQHLLTRNLPRRFLQRHPLALHQLLRPLVHLLELSRRRRLLIVPLAMLPMPETPPPARISAQPASLRASIAVHPSIPSPHRCILPPVNFLCIYNLQSIQTAMFVD
jgi:hypothetical protein